MATRSSDGVSWHVLLIVGGGAFSIASAAIWLGSNTNQITVNTVRIEKIEKFRDKSIEEEADLRARINSLERRASRIEDGMERHLFSPSMRP